MEVSAIGGVDCSITYPTTLESVEFVAIGPAKITKPGTADKVAFTGAETAAWAPGRYSFFVFATAGDSRRVVAEGRLTVAENPLTATSTDPRSWAEKALEAVEAVLSNQATYEQQQFTIANRTLVSRPLTELMDLLRKLKAEVIKERKKANGIPTNQISTVKVIFRG